MLKVNYGVNDDCVRVMDGLPDNCVDLIIADPPYGISFKSNRVKGGRFDKIKNDEKPCTEFIKHAKRILKPTGAIHIFTRWDVQSEFIKIMQDEGFKIRNVLIWDKGNHGMGDLKRAYGSRYESIIFSSLNEFKFQEKRPDDILVVKKVPPKYLEHPNQKPVELIEKLICQCTGEGDLVFDPFAGSGAVEIAAIKTKRNYIFSELDEEYFKLTKRRIDMYIGQTAEAGEGAWVPDR